ncbi:ferritin-like domain-containing protein [Winogradskyella ursingii]|uniref:ferritin-like domain-containing protein n=1 Tax=Winogradskyella ursingii TaxID=2686079 RepID=UPI0015C98EC3|nr:PA2169 family four-helix-bundle protein [Winogradskyella ursingii]
MKTYSEEIGNKLNDLLEKNYDAEKGYHKAAENVDHSGLKTFFERKSNQRRDFGHEIKQEIRSFGKEVDKGGSVTGAMHRAWMDVKALFSADDAESMLEEAIRGEKASVDEYSDVLKEASLPSSTRAVLEAHKNKISTDLSQIKSLENLR